MLGVQMTIVIKQCHKMLQNAWNEFSWLDKHLEILLPESMAKMNNKNKMKQNCKFHNVHRPLKQTGVAFGVAMFGVKSRRHLFHSKLVLPTFFKEWKIGQKVVWERIKANLTFCSRIGDDSKKKLFFLKNFFFYLTGLGNEHQI